MLIWYWFGGGGFNALVWCFYSDDATEPQIGGTSQSLSIEALPVSQVCLSQVRRTAAAVKGKPLLTFRIHEALQRLSVI